MGREFNALAHFTGIIYRAYAEPKDECLLWERTKDLAKDRGFELHGECPVISSCEGTTCFYISPSADTGPQQIEKFQTRQEKTDYLKLCELRREIKRMMPTGGPSGA